MKKLQATIAMLFILLSALQSQQIPIDYLQTQLPQKATYFTRPVLVDEIKGVKVEQIALTGNNAVMHRTEKGFKTVYLFLKGNGKVNAANTSYDIVPETVFLPNAVTKITLQATKNDTLHFLKISSKLTEQDLQDLKEFPVENTKNIYYAKFADCTPYTEPIKSANTVSRTILPNKYIPRVAMGTVQTKGPDKVGAHSHPMLEQLFLGLSKNNCTVYADDAKIELPEFAVLHIPLGSSHSVSVEKDEVLYYVWMDFFLDKKGEEWLKTHNVKDEK